MIKDCECQDFSKKPRVDFDMIQKPKARGGLGLISNKAQMIALAGKTMLWTIQEGDHTLQWIYRKKLGQMSLKRWGEMTILGWWPQVKLYLQERT